jgi:hypothetical protein
MTDMKGKGFQGHFRETLMGAEGVFFRGNYEVEHFLKRISVFSVTP